MTKLIGNKMLILGVATLAAYFLSLHIYQVQLVYEKVYQSKVTLVWFMALFGWQVLSGKLAAKIGGNVKRNGWILYFAGITPLVVYAVV